MAKRERGEGGLIKIRGCRYWYAQFYRDGRQVRVSTKTATKQKAIAELRRLMGDSERGLLPETEIKKTRYGDLRALLIQKYRDKDRKSLQTLADGSETIWGLGQLDRFFKFDEKHLGPPVTQLNDKTRDAFVKARRAEDVGPSVINSSLRHLRHMLNLGYRKNLLNRVPYIELLEEAPPREGFLEREKFEALVSNLPARLQPLVTFLYYCGVRVGEALQLDWSQVDLNEAVIELKRTQTKNKAARFVPLPDVLVHTLRQVKDKHGPVFDGESLRAEWGKACAAAGLGTLTKIEGRGDKRYHGLTVHDLRRSAIRNLIAAGVPEKVAMEISGHKTRSVFDRYNIVSKKQVLDAMRQVQDYENGEKSVKTLPFVRRELPQIVDK